MAAQGLTTKSNDKACNEAWEVLDNDDLDGAIDSAEGQRTSLCTVTEPGDGSEVSVVVAETEYVLKAYNDIMPERKQPENPKL